MLQIHIKFAVADAAQNVGQFLRQHVEQPIPILIGTPQPQQKFFRRQPPLHRVRVIRPQQVNQAEIPAQAARRAFQHYQPFQQRRQAGRQQNVILPDNFGQAFQRAAQIEILQRLAEIFRDEFVNIRPQRVAVQALRHRADAHDDIRKLLRVFFHRR